MSSHVLARALPARGAGGAVAALAALTLLACAPDSQPRQRLSALLVTLDTTRADALGAFGGPPGLTPALDALAADSLRYTQARTVVPFTLPAHASMLTGLYPPRHGVRDNAPAALVPEAETLAELAAAAGYQTAGFVAASPLDSAWGIAQGFQSWSQPSSERVLEARRPAERPAREVVDEAIAWLDRRDRARPFLVWVHLFDPHQPYEPEPRFLERAGGSAYHGEVAAMDAAIDRLLTRLRDEGLLDATAVVVVGDHGEGLGDHGEATHGYFPWDSTLRVPLLVRHPDGWRAGESSEETVSVVDVFPTLCDALELATPGSIDGASLWRTQVPPDRRVYFEALGGWARFGWSPLVGMADTGGKYVHSSRPVLWRPREDPAEQSDHLAELDDGGEGYLTGLREVLARPVLRRRQAGLDAPLAELARLGYAAGRTGLVEWPDPLTPSPRPTPLERTAEHAEYLEAREQAGSGQAAQAIGRLQALVEANPLHVAAMDDLGAAWIELEDWQHAAQVLERRAKLPPARVSTYKGLLRCYLELGRDIEAREAELRTLELLIEIAVQSGDLQQANTLAQIHAYQAADLERVR